MTNEKYAEVVATMLRVTRLATSTERALQDAIEGALKAANIPFSRELALSSRDRPDFLLSDGAVVLEAKVRYPKKAIYRQMARYASHQGVEALILVTGTAMGMPAAIDGKPVFVVSTGLGSLGC